MIKEIKKAAIMEKRLLLRIFKFFLFIFYFFHCASLYAQVRSVTGIVTNDKGQPLSGVSIIVKGKPGGTNTTSNGTFSIEASPQDSLQISYVGFITQTI